MASLTLTVAFIAAFLLSSSSDVRGQDAPGPLLLVLNKEEAVLSFITPSDGKTVARVQTGDAPHEVVVSPDARLAFVSNYGTGTAPGATLSVIDLAARKELRRVNLGALQRPHGLAYAAGKVFFTAEANRAVGAYDPESDRVDWVLGTGETTTHMVIASKDASRLFTANIGSDTVSLIERGANPLAWNVTHIHVGRGPEGIDVSPDGSQVWVAHSRDGGVSIVDTSQKKVIATVDAGTKRSNRLKFTPDGRHVLISDLEGNALIVIDVSGRKVIKRIPLGRSPEGILIVPDGSKAYIAIAGENHVAVLDLKTLEITGRIAAGAGPDGLAWVGPRP